MSEYQYKPGKLMMFFIIIFRIIFTAAVFLTIAFIFYNSAQVAEVSSGYSGKFTVLINKLLTYTPFDIILSEHQVRKLAHMAEFAALGFFLTFCLRVYTKRLIAFCAWPLLFGLFIAVCDEFLQRFVPGRSSSIKDIFIDFIGVCGGTGVAICIVFAVSFVFWLFWGRKRKKLRKAAWEKEKAEIDRARAFLKQQDEIKAQQQAEQARMAEIMGSDEAKILAENSK